jgi:hypothetical protein
MSSWSITVSLIRNDVIESVRRTLVVVGKELVVVLSKSVRLQKE